MRWLVSVKCFFILITVLHINDVRCWQNNFTEISTTSEATTTSRRTVGTTQKFQNRNMCQLSFTSVGGKRSCKGKLIFHEMFLNISDKWTPEKRFAGDPDYEFAMYEDNLINLFVEQDNFLHIKPTFIEDKYGKDAVTNPKGFDFGSECTGFPGTLDCVQRPKAWQILPPVISAQITTKNSFWFVYGVIEVRAKFPKGDWLYPEISLVSKDDVYGPGLESGRIRIAFSTGNEKLSTYVSGGCTLGYSSGARKFGIRTFKVDKPLYEDFHTYKLQWKTDSLSLFIDNELYSTIYPPQDGFGSEPSLELDPFTPGKWLEGTALAPFDQEMYIVIGVGVGGQMFHEELELEKPWVNDDPKAQLRFYQKSKEWKKTWSNESELIVDSVKVWAV
ncbi:hypothetical protein FQR65_LT10639 [Abscondita terminalis]|nr:hypothetical protein FQR65_LT10639 [Abscondita terminalis]